MQGSTQEIYNEIGKRISDLLYKVCPTIFVCYFLVH